MTIEAFLTETPKPDERLIKNGRYQITPADGKKVKAHTRITNFAKKLEDEYNLTKWKQRMVLLGAAQRSDITVAALAASDDKDALDALAEAALDAAKANVARETGSALHRLCERVDRGETLELPDPWRADVDAYTRALTDLAADVELIEQVVVYPRLTLAGRLDRTVQISGTRYICDLKTGADLRYSWGSIALQLALYAGAETVYDPITKEHRPMPDCDQSRALVIHLPAGRGEATPYWINLEAGRRGISLVERLLEWRRNTKLLATTDRTSPIVADEELREYVENRVRELIDGGYGGELARAWPDAIPTLKSSDEHTEQQLDLILTACSEIEARHTLPFPYISDPRSN